MKFYKIEYPGDSPSLMELETKEGKPVDSITVHQGGREPNERIISIPVIGNGPEIGVKRTVNGHVLVRGDWHEDGRCLVLLNVRRPADFYKVFCAEGIHFISDDTVDFRLPIHYHRINILVIFHPGAEFCLETWWYRWCGSSTLGWVVEADDTRRDRLALENGEWL